MFEKLNITKLFEKYLELLMCYPKNIGLAADYDHLASHARHMARVRLNMDYQKSIPEDIFCTYVLPCVVNDEPFEACSEYFFKELCERVTGLSLYEAAVTVNFWCMENVAYRYNDDSTAGPLAVFERGYGRCGEESVFAVMALRSVGIPARQCYAKRWSHCDDNHAWVEVFTEDGWHFLGACEAEPVLDRGWFVNASSKAMLITAREVDHFKPDEEILSHDHGWYTINCTPRYASVKRFNIKITENGMPAIATDVRLELINFNTFMPILHTVTDNMGCVSLDIGLGGVMVFAKKGEYFNMRFVDTSRMSHVEIDVADGELNDELYIEQKAPCGILKSDGFLYTEEQKSRIEAAKAVYSAKMEDEPVCDWQAPEPEFLFGNCNISIIGDVKDEDLGVERLNTHGFELVNVCIDNRRIRIPKGTYRICAKTRHIDGDISCFLRIISLSEGENTELVINKPKERYEGKLFTCDLPSEILAEDCILIMYDEENEPFLHVRQELFDTKSKLQSLNIGTCFIKKEGLPEFNEVLSLMRQKLMIGDERLPLTALVLKGKLRFAYANYNVGIIDTLIRIAEYLLGGKDEH
ncbi:MAG: transglutaminase domain-containing protein [Clostridia bacterium]|nr:transglutaminase domain-containing protein [Clostridia bacterium]